MLENIKHTWAFCSLFGFGFVIPKMLFGSFGRGAWWLLGYSVEDYNTILKRHLLDVIQRWYLSEKEETLDPMAEGIYLVCGFLIYAYAHDSHTHEMWAYCIRKIEHKKAWL